MNPLCASVPLTFITSTIFIFFFVSPVRSINNTLSSTDTIEQTCKTCASKSTNFDYSFCLSSLCTSPHTYPTKDLSGLAIASMLAAIENATATKSTIDQLLGDDTFDPYSHACLQDCLELYEDGHEILVEALKAFSRGDFATANLRLSAAMEAAETCDGGFEEGGREGPLKRENYWLFQLSAIALCITNMLSSGLHVLPS